VAHHGQLLARDQTKKVLMIDNILEYILIEFIEFYMI